MTCPLCKAKVSTGSLYCSSCGARTGAVAVAVAEPADPHEESLLAEANLLRMRGRWPEAEAKCVDVMRISPKSVHAHSLLGDIYREQGRLDEAAQWYQMALDLDPNSGADLAKLAAVEKQRAKLAKQSARTGTTKPQRHVTGVTGTQSLVGLSPAAFFKLVWAMVAIFALVVTALLLWVKRGPTQPPVPTGTLPGTANRPPTPETITGTLPTRDRGGRPAPPPSAAARDTALGAQNGSPPAEPGNAATPSGSIPSGPDTSLAAAIARQSGLGAQAQVGPIAINSQGRHATLVLTERLAPEMSDPARMREAVLGDVVRAAQAAFALSSAFDRLTINAQVGTVERQPEPFFAGTIDRASALRLQQAATYDQILGLFTAVWWSVPGSAGPPDAGSVPAGPGEAGPGDGR
jgi:hypothetical protein